jgi:hypothetical protein
MPTPFLSFWQVLLPPSLILWSQLKLFTRGIKVSLANISSSGGGAVASHPALAGLSPGWGQGEDPNLVQSIAETLLIDHDKDLPEIVRIVRASTVPPSERIGVPAYTPNNFYDNLADQNGPESFLTNFDIAEVKGDVPKDLPKKIVKRRIRQPDGSIKYELKAVPKILFSNLRLPAHGFGGSKVEIESGRRKYECGRFLVSKTYGCPSWHELHPVRCECHRLDCPVCYPGAVRRMAHRIATSLFITDQLYDGTLSWHHVVLSPPQEDAKKQWGTPEGFKDSNSEAVRVLKAAGARGGVMIPHAYRQNNGSLEWRAGPHWHFIVNGRIEYSKIPDGWVCKTVRKVDASRFDFYCLAYYLCSHAAVGDGLGQIVSYFGNCAKNSKKAKAVLYEFKEVVPMSCKTCEGGLYRYREWLSYTQGFAACVPAMQETLTTRAWCIRDVLDDLRSELSCCCSADLLALDDPRVFVELPEAVHSLTSEEIAAIDANMDPAPGPGPVSRSSCGVPGGFPEVVRPRLPRSVRLSPSSPGPGGGGGSASAGAVRHA